MKIPRGLGADGRALWRAISGFLDSGARPIVLDPHELAVLVEACRIADRLAQLREVLDGADLADAATVRLLSEERQQRTALSTLLITRLGLPTGLPSDEGATASTPTARRAQRAAQSRWSRHVPRAGA